jgi:hypothetical protein
LQTQLGWAAIGAAAVSLGAVIYLDVQRRSLHSDYTEARADYEQGNAPADPAAEAESDLYRTRTLEVTMGIISAVLAGAGSALLLYQPSSDDDSGDRSSASQPGAGFTWAGTF